MARHKKQPAATDTGVKSGLKILVTGANGFVGQNLIRELVEQGHDVYALVRSEGNVSKRPFTPKWRAYTNVPGDRFFIEVGWDKDGTTSGSIGISYGKAGSTDFVGDGSTSNFNGWVEVSPTITFDAEGTTYGTNPNGLMLRGTGA